MAQLQIRTLVASCFKASGLQGQLEIQTDVAIPDPAPADFEIELKVYNAIPDVDFLITGFTWALTATDEYTGTKVFPYTTLAPTTPLVLLVVPLANSQIGDNDKVTFEIIDNGLYTVDPTYDDVTFTVTGNTRSIVLAPPQLEVVNDIKAENENWIHAVLINETAGDLEVVSIDIPDDSGVGNFTYFVDSGANTWNTFISGSSGVVIGAGLGLKILIKMDGPAALDFSTYHLYTKHKEAYIDTSTYYEAAWGFAGITEIGALTDCASACVDVELLSFTWMDGSTKGPYASVTDAIDLGSFSGTNLSETYVDIDVKITNNCTGACVNQANGYLRIGDLESGWYSIFGSDNDSSVVIQTAVPTVDSGFVLASGANTTITLRITTVTADGAYRLVSDILKRDCIGPAITLPNTRTSSDILTVGITDYQLATETGTALNLIDIAGTSQGNTGVWASQTSSYTYAAKSVVGASRTGYVFTAIATKTHYVTIHWSLGSEITASERDLSYYINGAWVGILSINTNPHSGRAYLELALTAGDELALAVYTDITEVISDSIGVAISYQPQDAAPDICTMGTVDIAWDVVTADMEIYPIRPEASSKVGEQETLTITLTNNGNFTETITGITIDPALASDLSIYFPSEIEIGPGLSHDFDFAFLPSSIYTASTGLITFTQEVDGDIVSTVVLTGTASTVLCTISTYQNNYAFAVDLDSQLLTSDVTFNTADNFGRIRITSPSTQITFPDGTGSYTANYYDVNVNAGTSVPIPMAILVPSPCPAPPSSNITLSWDLYDDNNVSLCSGEVLTRTAVGCPDTETQCPVQFQQTNVVESELGPSDTGEITIDIQLNESPSITGEAVYEFTLPVGELLLDWVNPQTVVAGISWDLSRIASDPKKLTVTVADSCTAESFPLILEYAIPADETTKDYESMVAMVVTFANVSYVCDTSQVSYVTLSISSTATAGGFAASLSLSDNDLCATINMVDGSNYGADGNHDALDFDLYREIVITIPNGSEYILSSLTADNGELITPASGLVYSFEGNISVGGIYSIALYTVPTHQVGGSYNEDDCVVIADGDDVKFFKSLQDSNTDTPNVTPGWEDWWVELDDRTDVTSGYTNTALYTQICEITQIKLDLQETLFCAGQSQCADYDFCFMSYEAIKMYETLISEAVNYNWYDKAVLLYNDAKTISDKTTNC